MRLVLGLYSIASCCLRPAAVLLLELVGSSAAEPLWQSRCSWLQGTSSVHTVCSWLTSHFLSVWNQVQSGYKSAKGCSISARLLWGTETAPPQDIAWWTIPCIYCRKCMRGEDTRVIPDWMLRWDVSFFNCTVLFWPFPLYSAGIIAKGCFICLSILMSNG